MISFKANDSFIETPGMNMTNAFTISFSYNVIGTASCMFYNKEYCYELALFADRYLYYALQDSDTTNAWSWAKTIRLNKTNKHWLTFIYDGTNVNEPTVKIYIDGGLEYTEHNGIIPVDLYNQTSSGLYFGNSLDNNHPSINLKMD